MTNEILGKVKTLRAEVKALTDLANAAVRNNQEERQRSAALVDNFNKASAGSLAHVAGIKDYFVSNGKYVTALKLPGHQDIENLVDELAKAVHQGEKERTTQLSAKLNGTLDLVIKGMTVMQNNVTAKKRNREKLAESQLKDQIGRYSGGMFVKCVQDKDFQSSLTNLVNIRTGSLKEKMQHVSAYEKIVITKPGASNKGVNLAPSEMSEDEIIEGKYCKVKDLPLRSATLITVGNTFDVHLNKTDFISGKVLDSPVPSIPSDLDYIAMIKEYARNRGELRYFYKCDPTAVSKMYEARNYPLGEKPASTDLKKFLVYDMTIKLLYGEISDSADNMLFDAVEDIKMFRGNVLNWGVFSGVEWTPTFSAASIYPPESLDNFLFGYKKLYETVREYWKFKVDMFKKGVTFSEKSDLKEIQSSIDELLISSPSDQIDKEIIEYADTILFYLGHAHTKTSSPKSDQFSFFYETSITLFGRRFDFRIPVPVKKIDTNYVQGFLETPAYSNEKAVLHAKLKEAVDATITLSNEIDEDWHLADGFICYRIFKEFFETVKRLAEEAVATNLGLIVSQKSELKRLLSKKESVKKWHANRRQSYRLLYDEIASGMLYSEFVNNVSNTLRGFCRSQKVIVDSYVPLVVLSEKSGAYGELPVNPYSIERLGYEREGDFFRPEPKTGILKHYGLEIRHKGFGAGSHLYSQSLFPGETVSVDMRTSHKSKVTKTESSAENIFEEASSETQNDFSRELASKLENEKKTSRTSEKEISGSAGFSFEGVFNAGVSASSKRTAQDDERRFSDLVENVLDKLSTKLSQKRQVTLDVKRGTTSEEEFEQELKTARTYSNSNKEKNLTINFFQITREFETSIFLKDMQFFYSSGRHPLLKVFLTPKYSSLFGNEPVLFRNSEYTIPELADKKIFETLPPELWDVFPDEAFVVITAQPYTVKLSLSQTNAFLVSTFDPAKAREINESVWKITGGGPASPDGLAVTAFPFGKEDELQVWPVGNDEKEWENEAIVGLGSVCADVVELTAKGGAKQVIKLPNLDLRYKSESKVPTRYTDDEKGFYSLPKLLWSKSYIINTNGIYAENMLGRCSALEDFATEHRRLDVEQKEIQVEKERISLERYRALTPPNRKDFGDEESYNIALKRYNEMKKLDGETRYEISAPQGANLNLNMNTASEKPNLNVSVVKKPEGDSNP